MTEVLNFNISEATEWATENGFLIRMDGDLGKWELTFKDFRNPMISPMGAGETLMDALVALCHHARVPGSSASGRWYRIEVFAHQDLYDAKPITDELAARLRVTGEKKWLHADSLIASSEEAAVQRWLSRNCGENCGKFEQVRAFEETEK